MHQVRRHLTSTPRFIPKEEVFRLKSGIKNINKFSNSFGEFCNRIGQVLEVDEIRFIPHEIDCTKTNAPAQVFL